MRYNIRLLQLFLLFIVCSCSNSLKEFSSSKEVISIDDAFNNPIVDFKQFIDSTWIVSLKTPKEYMQGELTKVVASKDRIITFDELKSKRINVYTSDGDFLFPISRLGRGPKEVISMSDFSIFNDDIFVVDPIQQRVLKFSLMNGEYLRSFNLPFGALEFHQINDNRYLFILTDYNIDMGEQYLTNSCVITDSLFQPVLFGGKHPAANTCRFYTRSHWNAGDSSSFYSMYDETIYKYDSGELIPYVSFDFGKDNLTDRDLRNIDAYMSCFEDENRAHFTTDSPIFINDCVFALILKNRTKYFLISKDGVGYTKKVVKEDYKLTYPYFIVGRSRENILISCIQVDGVLDELRRLNVDMTNSVNNILLFSRIK